MTIITKKVYFHDQDVTALTFQGNVLFLGVDVINDDDVSWRPASITFYGVTNLTMNGNAFSDVTDLFDDGDIIHCETNNQDGLIIIEWYNFEKKERVTYAYKFQFDHMEMIDRLF